LLDLSSNKHRGTAIKIKWLDKPQKHDYSAAALYLSLTLDAAAAKVAAEQLKKPLRRLRELKQTWVGRSAFVAF
jgi:hypothetical protein